jgi:uncharacterized protein involved in exopolysaccharide biosynthesis
MTHQATAHAPASAGREISLLTLLAVLLRWRRTIIALALVGGALGIASGLTKPRVYKSETIFIPQGAERANSELVTAAGQLGLRVPTSGSTWGPRVYIQLLRSRALLEPIALDTFTVAEEGNRRVPLTTLLEVNAPTQAEERGAAVGALRGLVEATEVDELGGVNVSVTTRWPSVSHALANRLVSGVNQFNVETRKSQAAAERQFVEAQAAEAERALRVAEDRLQSFLQRNREIAGSPVLAAERDRLQRDVTLRQELHTSWLKSREEARIREVRDTPVITVFEEPQLPTASEPRNSVQKGIMGGIAGGILGGLIALLAHGMAGARRAPREDARELFQLMEEAKPRFLRKVR